VSSYEKYRETAGSVTELALEVIKDPEATHSQYMFAAEALYQAGMLRGLMIAGEPVDSPTMHKTWLKTARAMNDIRRHDYRVGCVTYT